MTGRAFQERKQGAMVGGSGEDLVMVDTRRTCKNTRSEEQVAMHRAQVEDETPESRAEIIQS